MRLFNDIYLYLPTITIQAPSHPNCQQTTTTAPTVRAGSGGTGAPTATNGMPVEGAGLLLTSGFYL